MTTDTHLNEYQRHWLDVMSLALDRQPGCRQDLLALGWIHGPEAPPRKMVEMSDREWANENTL